MKTEKYGQEAFTLIEIIFVVAIISVLIVSAVIYTNSDYTKLRAAARELCNNMQLARFGAIKDGQDWAIVFNTVGNSYSVISKYGTASQATEHTVNLSTDYSSNVVFGDGGHAGGTTVTFGGLVARFQSDGVCTFGSAYMQLSSDNSRVFKTSLALSGRPETTKWNGATFK